MSMCLVFVLLVFLGGLSLVSSLHLRVDWLCVLLAEVEWWGVWGGGVGGCTTLINLHGLCELALPHSPLNTVQGISQMIP